MLGLRLETALVGADEPLERTDHVSTLQPYNPLLPAGRTGRALSRLSNGTTLAVATVQSRAEVEARKIDAVSAVAAKAMQDVALLSQMEQSLALAVPQASGRLATIADLAAVSMAGIVADTGRRIGG